MITEKMKLLELTVAEGIHKFKDDGLVPSIVFTSRIDPDIKTILGLEVIQTNLLEPDKIILITEDFFKLDNPWKFNAYINLED